MNGKVVGIGVKRSVRELVIEEEKRHEHRAQRFATEAMKRGEPVQDDDVARFLLFNESGTDFDAAVGQDDGPWTDVEDDEEGDEYGGRLRPRK